jgi:integrase
VAALPKKRLTAAMVERITPPAKGQAEYWDRNMPGFGLRVSYRGTKAWVLMTRIDGKLARITLGDADVMSLAAAHEAAREVKRQAKAGVNPRDARQQRQVEAQETRQQAFGAIADQFIDRYASKLRSRTTGTYKATLKGKLTEPWHERPVTSISRRDVIALLDGLEVRGKHAMAKLVLAHLRKFFSWCADRDLISEMPTHRIRLNGSLKPRERALNLDELRRVWSAAEKVGGTGGALTKLLILTGQRRHETSVMLWSDLSGLESGTPLWSIPREVTKNHRPHDVPLAPEAVDVIRSRPIITVRSEKGEDKSELVFTTAGKVPWAGFGTLKRQIDEQIADDGGEPMAPWTYHDLRRSLVTGMNDRGLAQPHVIEPS